VLSCGLLGKTVCLLTPASAEIPVASPENHLIERLPRAERVRLRSVCEPVQLQLSEVLCDAGTPTALVYFPTEGFISLVAQLDGNRGLEVGMVGREGMLGAHLAQAVVTQPLHALVAGGGAAWRVGRADFMGVLSASPALQKHLQRYLYVLMAQLATAAACLRFHLIEPRLARWLLMSQDGAHADRFQVTHAFLATMLGVRREGITAAAGALQRQGLIAYHRGDLTVVNRAGLEAVACACYAEQRRIYTELLD
jgi:CRP-like cAMP-binding protein